MGTEASVNTWFTTNARLASKCSALPGGGLVKDSSSLMLDEMRCDARCVQEPISSAHIVG